MEDRLLNRFRNILKQYNLVFQENFLVCVSGGIDSIVLCNLIHTSKLPFSIAHCNFSLREGESDQDEVFVKELAKKYDVKYYNKKFSPPKNENIQIWARNVRYQWFEEIREKYGFSKIVVGHHLDDNLETVLMNFIRGTGLEGLTGMDLECNNIIRPLIYFSRDEILEYARKKNISWREDTSNKNKKYFRNRLRHDLLPMIKNNNKHFFTSFQKTLNNLNLINTYYLQKIKEDIESIKENYPNALFCIDIEKLKKLKNEKLILYEIFKDYGFSKMIDNIFLSIDKNSGKKFLTKNYRLLKDRKKLILSELETKDVQEYLIHKDTRDIDFPIKMQFDIVDNNFNFSTNTYLFDFDKLVFPLKIRRPRKGDCFYPFGMKGRKKLSKYFKDEKLSNIEKENIWLLCSNETIICIIGKRQSNTNIIDEVTKKSYICKLI